MHTSLFQGKKQGVMSVDRIGYDLIDQQTATFACDEVNFSLSCMISAPSTPPHHTYPHQLGSELIRHIYVTCNATVMGSVEACFNRYEGQAQQQGVQRVYRGDFVHN